MSLKQRQFEGELPLVRTRPSSVPRQLFLFAANFFMHPKQLGSIIPSSRYLVNNLLSRIDWPNAKVIVEYGPGIGNMTQEILKRMSPDAILVAIEMNPEFVEFIERECHRPKAPGGMRIGERCPRDPGQAATGARGLCDLRNPLHHDAGFGAAENPCRHA